MPLASAQFLFEAPWLWPLAAGAMLLVFLGVLRLYPRQLAQSRGLGAGRWLLPGLRLLGLAALIAALLKPVALRQASSDDRGAVLVLVDRSASMGVTDNTRPMAEQVALCDALGRIPAGAGIGPGAQIVIAADIARLPPLADQVRAAQDDLEYARISGQELPAKQTHLADAITHYTQAVGEAARHVAALGPSGAGVASLIQRLAAIPGVDDRSAWSSSVPARIDQAAGAVARYEQRADEKLYNDNAAVRTACEAVAQLNRFSLAQAVLLGSNGLLNRLSGKMPVSCDAFAAGLTPLTLTDSSTSLGAQPIGGGSDLTGAIPAAIALQAGSTAPVRAVVLLSDGRQVGGDRSQVAGLTPAGVPIYAVPLGSAAPPRDVAIDPGIIVPTAAFAGETVAIRALIRQTGFAGNHVTVSLAATGDPPQTQDIVLGDRQPTPVDFTIKLMQPGAQRLDLSVLPLPGEATAANNSAQRWIKVLSRRMQVAVYSGSAGWDFQYLRNALDRAPWVKLNEGVLRGDAHCPLSTEEILDQNVIVLMDVPVDSLDGPQWEAVNTLVRERGGSVILVAGDAHLPGEYGTSGLTAGLLPFDPQWIRPAWRASPGGAGPAGEAGGFQVLPDSSAEQMDLLRLAPGLEQSLRKWEELPGMYRLLELAAAGGISLRPGTRVLLREAQGHWPVLTEMRLDAGRAFFFAGDETWRWRFRVGGDTFERFWLQLVRYATEEPYFAVNAGFALDVDTVGATPEQVVHLRARMPLPVTGHWPKSVEVDILRAGSPIQTHSLAPSGNGRYASTLSLSAGDYELRLQHAGPKPVIAPLHVEQTNEAELADVSGDAGMLRRIAEASGGELVPLDRIRQLPDLLQRHVDTGPKDVEMRLWESPYLFLFVVACFSAEWALRKRYGLA